MLNILNVAFNPSCYFSSMIKFLIPLTKKSHIRFQLLKCNYLLIKNQQIIYKINYSIWSSMSPIDPRIHYFLLINSNYYLIMSSITERNPSQITIKEEPTKGLDLF